VFIGFGNTPSQRRLFAVVLRRQGGQYAIEGRVRQDDNTSTTQASSTSPPRPT